MSRMRWPCCCRIGRRASATCCSCSPRTLRLKCGRGFRWGTEGAVERYGADVAHPLDQLSEKLPEYLAGAEAIAFRVGRHASVESQVLSAWGRQLDTYARTGTAALGLVAPTPILHRLRLRKEPHELER